MLCSECYLKLSFAKEKHKPAIPGIRTNVVAVCHAIAIIVSSILSLKTPYGKPAGISMQGILYHYIRSLFPGTINYCSFIKKLVYKIFFLCYFSLVYEYAP